MSQTDPWPCNQNHGQSNIANYPRALDTSITNITIIVVIAIVVVVVIIIIIGCLLSNFGIWGIDL
eukprot:8582410-Karenia_brevis.AAC.1